MLFFPHILSIRGVIFPLHMVVIVFVRSVDFTSRLGVGENFQSQDLCISSCLDHLLRKPSKWLDGQDIFSVSTVHDLTGALLLTWSNVHWLCRLTYSRGS